MLFIMHAQILLVILQLVNYNETTLLFVDFLLVNNIVTTVLLTANFLKLILCLALLNAIWVL